MNYPKLNTYNDSLYYSCTSCQYAGDVFSRNSSNTEFAIRRSERCACTTDNTPKTKAHTVPIEKWVVGVLTADETRREIDRATAVKLTNQVDHE